MAERCIRYFVSGRVQGVNYRASARDRARGLGLEGYVRNLPDGRVEVVAYGDGDALERLRQWLQQGPPMAMVEAVVTEHAEPPDLTGFQIR